MKPREEARTESGYTLATSGPPPSPTKLRPLLLLAANCCKARCPAAMPSPSSGEVPKETIFTGGKQRTKKQNKKNNKKTDKIPTIGWLNSISSC